MNDLKLACKWTVLEREWLPISRRDIWIPRLTRKNLFTNYGLSALASAPSGNYVAPVYLAIESFFSPLNGPVNPGDMSLSINTPVDQSGDTQVVVDIGSPNQEVVSFSSVSGTSAPYTYNLTTPFQYSHPAGAKVVRQVNVNDTISNLTTEVQYDPVGSPGLRLASGAGYSLGNGQYTIQFYFTSTMAVAYLATCGLTDSTTIGQGNLHNHFVLGYDHSLGTNDVQINGNLTIVNS
ncbi:hypothetical protein [Ktedonospora formicarum]|uniref:Uncharacterized protein n=1 Tax=Ktedonospora formicarum TaxID=2778364 RepID=A0A8J3I066_9CHLR|nr:hypothetical protein [Ktedonospora formicarum]GHO45196.1 hypothetical protein KSX_33590 [Ktedonospora formicarum]